MTDDQSDRILEIALDWHRSGKGAVLATVQETWGSAPRQAGSQLVVSRDGEMMGSVSGGCVEGAVVIEAVAALADGKSRLLTYGVSDENAFSVGLACGGTIKVLVEPVGAAFPVAILSDLVAARAARQPVALQSLGQGGDHRLIPAGQDAAVDARLRSDKAGTEADGRFIVPHNPPLRLIVVGAVHIAVVDVIGGILPDDCVAAACDDKVRVRSAAGDVWWPRVRINRATRAPSQTDAA